MSVHLAMDGLRKKCSGIFGHRPMYGGGYWLWLVVIVVGRDDSRVPGDYGVVITVWLSLALMICGYSVWSRTW